MTTIKRNLYRIPSQGKVAGVCAGVAEYFGMEVWLVRVLFASAIIISGVFSLPLLIYAAAYLLLDRKPQNLDPASITVKSKVWQCGELPQQALADVQQRFGQIELRLQQMEHYVTSASYSLKREIDRL